MHLAGVTKRYGAVTAVDAVTVDVTQGEFVTILGPSGSGKTTLLTLVAGLTEPTAGSIRIGARDVTWVEPADRNLGLVFQSYALFPHMSVFDNVAFPLRVRGVERGEIRRRVREALETVRLADYGARKPSQLSGGQQQRVALARAFVFGPDILLLDEPLGALDRKLREEVQVELKQLQRTLGITTVLVTHDQEEALSLSDRILVLDHGRVQQVGSPDAVYRQPANRFVAGFLGIANLFEGRAEGGVLRLASGDGVACAARATGSATAVVRPEHVRLGPPGGPGLAATVREVIYLGQLRRVHLVTAWQQEVIAVSMDLARPLVGGDAVSLTWAPEHVWVLPDGSVAADAEPEEPVTAPARVAAG